MTTRTHFDAWIASLDQAGVYISLPEMQEINMQIFSDHVSREMDGEQMGPDSFRAAWEEGELNGELRPNTASAILSGMLAGFIRCGRQVFTLGPGMAEMLSKTSTDNITPEDIKMPYQTFWVAFPPGFMSMTSSDGDGDYIEGHDGRIVCEQAHDAWGMYVNDLEEGVMIVIWGHEALSLDDLPNIYDRSPMDAGFALWVPIPYDQMVELGSIEKVIGENNLGRVQKAVRVAFNLMLYLNSDGAEEVRDDITWRRAQNVDQRYKEARSMSESKVAKLATKIYKKQHCRIRYIAPTIEEKLSATERVKHWVRGHWHTYWTGKGRALRKLLWVMPHERGKVEGKQPVKDTRVYELGETDGENPDKHQAQGESERA